MRPDLVQLTWQTGYGEAKYDVYSVAADGSLDGPLQTWSFSGETSRVFLPTTAETTTSYVVRSVASDDQRSAPSETVTVTTPPRWQSGVELAVYGPFDEGTVTLTASVQNSPEDRFVTLAGEMTFTIDGGEPRTVPLGVALRRSRPSWRPAGTTYTSRGPATPRTCRVRPRPPSRFARCLLRSPSPRS